MIDAVVVGSGISGLSVARWLKKKGIEPVVFEKEDRIGGNIWTQSREGFTYELGPQTLLADGEVKDFFKTFGIKYIKASPSAKKRYVLKGGRLLPVPTDPLSFIKTPLLSLGAKLRVLREPWVAPSIKSDESVAEFVKRRFGQEFLDYLVAPFISGVYAGDPGRLSVRHAVRKVYALEEEFGSVIRGAIKKRALSPPGEMVSFEGGLSTLTEELSKGLEIRKENVVLKIVHKDGIFHLDTRGGKLQAKAVVIASPAYTASYLLKNISWSASNEFDSIDYVPMVVLNLYTSESVPEGFGFLVPRKEGRRILGVIFASNIFPDRAPAGKNLLSVYIGGATDREAIELEDEELISIVERELKEILSLSSLQVLSVKKWKRAIPQYNLGYERYLRLAEEIEREHEGLFLTGNYRFGVSMADCIRASREVADRVERYLERSSA